ncbi:SusC/RagA family TonB-linked outer membrane protein [Mucilaginibacter mali]|uniref:SusC/RagA family TonB-linked outer membrane protein n=1 Tax=Mucilaginibacter mali TaxID=2740462 RepID=A0A7D4UGJ9_9SPHI|nr:SusC/RagA family TonB-linked outer membrane protein [Mucilaginibacter mali]QKJ31936.1 SusC/RagA family TonB-linked outer membrane protein [Mucilaginibacter mali]
MKKQITLLITVLLTACMYSFAQINVKGTVKDSKNQPIPGATVKVKETGKAAASDINGNYTISAAANNTLVFSSVGYTSIEERVGNRTTINAVLADDSKQLSDVVVIGYGTRAQKDVTGAITSVKAEKLEVENPASIADLIKGNVAGITVALNVSPKGGGTGDLQIRGKATLTASSSPLIVLDGVVYQGQMADINPNDIERVDVLRDASALAVYGSASAAGVVAITTKKGKLGAPQINLNMNVGFEQLEKNQKFYGPEGFLAWRADGARASNVNNPYYYYSNPNALPDGVTLAQFMGTSTGDPTTVWLQRLGLQNNEIANYNAGKTTDWAKLVFRTGLRQDYTASLSGRNDNTSYYLSGNYTKNQNLIQGGEYKNYRARVNLEGKAAKFLTVGMSTQFASRDEGGNQADWTQIINSSPYGDFYLADGVTLRRIDTDDSGLNQRNPFLATYYNQTVAIQNTLFANLYAKLRLPLGIQYQLNFAPDIESYRNFNFIPVANPNELAGGEASRSMENRYKYILDNLLTWNKTFGGIHNIDITALLEKEKYQTWYTNTSNSGLTPSDVLGYHSIGAGILPVESSDDRVYNADAIMGRLNYTLMGRYMLTASVRRDGFSPFGLQFPRSTYPTGAVAWVLSDEKFMKTKTFDWLNYAKLRVSYGVNGNRLATGTADPSLALALISTAKYPTVSSSGTVTNNVSLYASSLQNPNLKWERTTGINLGLDWSILHDRINGSFDVYNRKTTDLIVNRTLLTIQGFGAGAGSLTNIGEVNNKGFEVSVNTKNINSRNFNWTSSATFFVNRNKIVHLYGPATTTDASGNTVTKENDDTGNGWFIGHDISSVWDYRILGVWQANETAEMAKYVGAGLRPGDFKLQDVDGDYKFTDADKQFLGSRTPQFNWSLRNDFNFLKNFDFSFLLVSAMGQLSTFNEAKNNPGSVGFARQSSYILPYWTADNPINDYARLNSGSSGTTINVFRKSSFVRVNTVSLAYTLDKKLVQRLGMQSARVFVNSNNAYVLTGWEFWDPQNSGPTPRIVTAGINVTF